MVKLLPLQMLPLFTDTKGREWTVMVDTAEMVAVQPSVLVPVI
jgi:hypothetical protein